MLAVKKRKISNDEGTQTADVGTQTDAASEIGAGLPVAKVPRNPPHLYNNNYTVRLTYCDTFLHDLDPGAASSQVFRMNSIYDPDYSNVGHQPICRDLWASMYNYYTVLQADYEFHFYNGTITTTSYTASDGPGHRLGCAVACISASTSVTDIVASNVIFPQGEMKNVRTEFLAPDKVTSVTGSLTQGDFIVDAKDSDSDTTWVAVGSNPPVPRFFGYNLIPTLKSSLVGQNQSPTMAITAFVKIHYTVQFTEVATAYRQASS